MKKTTFLLAALLCAGQALAGGLKWENKLDSDVRFKMIHDSGLVIVGTEQTVYGFNPETGAEKWKIEKVIKNYDPESVQPPIGSPYLIYVYKTGMFDTSPDVRCLNIITGQEIWSKETAKPLPEITAQVAAALGKKAGPEESAYVIPSGWPVPFISFMADEARGQFLLGTSAVSLGVGKLVKTLAGEVVNAKPKLFDQGAILAYDMKTGDVKWFALIPDKTGNQKTKLTYQWSRPQLVGDRLIVDWAGLHVFSVKDGSYLVGAAFDRSNLKGANARTVVDGNMAYVTSAGQITAVDITTGQIKWQTKKDGKAAYTEVYATRDKLVLKRGGTFVEGYAAKAKGGGAKTKTFEYGLDVLDKNTGQPTFDSQKLHDKKEYRINDMTNLLVEGDMVYFASAGRFRAFDLNQSAYKYIVGLGEDQGDFDGVKSVSRTENYICVLMKQTTKAINPADGSIIWTNSIEPPKASALGVAFLTALSAMAAVAEAYQDAQASAQGFGSLGYKTYTYRVYDQADFYQGRSAATSQYNYVMGQEDKKPTIVGVNLDTGKDDRRAVMDKQEADYSVDERWGLLVNVEKKKTLQVYDLNE